jgi:hypothetical protein
MIRIFCLNLTYLISNTLISSLNKMTNIGQIGKYIIHKNIGIDFKYNKKLFI